MKPSIPANFKVPGFLAAGMVAGIKKNQPKDLALLYSETPAVAAGVFTTNRVKAAPVVLSLERIKSGKARAVLANSGCANACTGKEGWAMGSRLSEACGILKIDPESPFGWVHRGDREAPAHGRETEPPPDLVSSLSPTGPGGSGPIDHDHRHLSQGGPSPGTA